MDMIPVRLLFDYLNAKFFRYAQVDLLEKIGNLRRQYLTPIFYTSHIVEPKVIDGVTSFVQVIFHGFILP